MTAREYLERPETLRLEIDRKRNRIETLRRLSTRFSAPLSDVQVLSSPDPSRMQTFLDDAMDEEAEIRLLEEKRNHALVDIALLISGLPDEKAAQVLELRYLNGISWEEIADRMGCCTRTVYRLHRLALSILTPLPEVTDRDE